VIQVRVGRLSFAVGSVQFTGRRSVDTVLAVLPVIVVAAAALVIITTCLCWLQRRVARRRSKLSPNRTEYNVNYVHISEPSFQSDVSGTVSGMSGTVPPRSDIGVHLPQTSKLLCLENNLLVSILRRPLLPYKASCTRPG